MVKFYWKRTFTKRYLLRADLANQKLRRYATEASTMGVLYAVRFLQMASVYLGVGYLKLLILSKAMREPARGISEK